MAHVVDGKAADQRPAYYDLVKFAVQKEAEINFNEAKKTRDSTSKPKAPSHFHFNHKKSGLPATPAVGMVAPAPEEGSGEEVTPFQVRRVTVTSLTKLYRKTQPYPRAMWRLPSRVAQASEAFTGRCFRCNKVGHQFRDEECEMFDPEFLNTSQGPAKISMSWQTPGAKGQSKSTGTKATH